VSAKLDVQVVTESFMGLATLLRGTERIALMPGRFAEMLRDTADIRLLAPPMPLQELVFAMAWPTLYARDEGHAWFRAQIAEVATAIEAFAGLARAM
jgi:LysR family nod box-dependent transcriptional activator